MTRGAAPTAPGSGSPQSRGVSGTVRLLVAVGARAGRARLVWLAVLLVLSGLTDGVGLLLLVPVLNSLGNDGQATLTLPGGFSWTGPLAVLLGLVVALVALRSVLSRVTDIASARLRLDIIDDLRHDALDALLHARWSFFLTRRRSDLVQTVVVDAMRAGTAADQLTGLATTAALTVAAAVVAIVLSPVLALLVLAAAAGVMAASWPSIRTSHERGTAFGEVSRRFGGTTTDALDSLRLVRAHDAAEPWLEALHADSDAVRDNMLTWTRRMSTQRAVIQVGSALGAALLVLLALRSGEPVAQVLVLVLVVARVLQGSAQLLRQAQNTANLLPAIDDVVTLTSAARRAREAPYAEGAAGAPLPDPHAAPPQLDLRDVRVAYPGADHDALHDVTLSVPAGCITAVAGPSGAGKSTLVDLVLGLLQPDSGALLVDGVALAPAGLAAWRSRLAYVPQDVTLVPGTLRTNLTWTLQPGAPADDARLWAALDDASAAFVRDLPDGLDTLLGDRGTRLSGGERQRVALARALLREPAMLVLDEATSALDGVTESEVQARLRALRGRCTVLLVAHRASTVAVADHVVLLNAGEVLEQGTFLDLLQGAGPLERLLASGLPG